MTPIYLNDFYQLGSLIGQLRMTLSGNLNANRNSKYDLIIGILKVIERITLRNELDESITNSISNLIQKLQNTSILNNQANSYFEVLNWVIHSKGKRHCEEIPVKNNDAISEAIPRSINDEAIRNHDPPTSAHRMTGIASRLAHLFLNWKTFTMTLLLV